MKEIAEALANNDYRPLEKFMAQKYSQKHGYGKYLGKVSVDFLFKHMINGEYKVLESAFSTLDVAAEQRFGKEVSYVPFICNHLMPEKLVLEIWGYKWIS